MSNSFEKINYGIRVSKAVERKMFSFAFKRLQAFDNISNYRYVGFGSTFFQDYILFHRDLGIEKMISIENKEDVKSRFEFNKPYYCIKMEYGDSYSILPKLPWTEKTILWLDYDGMIDTNHFSDVSTFFSNAISGSVFLITINVHPSAYGESNSDRRDLLIKLLGEDKLPYQSKLTDFSSTKLSQTLKNIYTQEIYKILNTRNGVLPEADKLNYRPIFNFLYQDGAKMMTIGGIIYNNSETQKYDSANFQDIDFVSETNFFDIKNPSLTMKEIRLINSQLPLGVDDGKFLDELVINPDIPQQDIMEYAKLYKFFPVFAESIIS